MTMTRKPSPRVTKEMAAHIRFLIQKQGLYQHQVASLLDLNQGRVSEVMRGYRYPDIPPSQNAFPF
jgi:transcriptional regulator with XRE-family HTH domain